MTSLSSHLFGCLVRNSNYRPWPVTLTCNVSNPTEILFLNFSSYSYSSFLPILRIIFPNPTVYPHLLLCYSCIKLQVLSMDSIFAHVQSCIVGWMISDTCKEHSVFICKGCAPFLLTAWSMKMKTLYSLGTSRNHSPIDTRVFRRGLNIQLCCCEDVESHRFLVFQTVSTV
jgi:hypothetical protein